MSIASLAPTPRARALRTRLVQSLLAALAALPATSDAVTYDMVFSATDLNMWGSGSTTALDHTSFYGGSWSGGASGGDIESTIIGSFGAEGSVSSSGRVGLEVDFHSQNGGIDLNLPYRVTITPSGDLTTAGQHTLNISSQLNLAAGASAVTTRFPNADFSVRGIVEAQASIQGELCVFGCIEGGGTIFDFAENFPIFSYRRDTTSNTQIISAFGMDHAIGNGLTLPINNTLLQDDHPLIASPLRIRLGTLTVAPPNLDATSTGNNLTTHASQESLVALQADILGIASYSLGLPVNPFDLRASVLGITFNGTLLSASAGISLGLDQDIAVDPGLGMTLHSSVPLSYLMADGEWSAPTQAYTVTDLGQPIVINRDTAGDVAIFPEFFLTPTITNQLDLLFSGTFDMMALQAGIGIKGATLASVGPLWSLNESIPFGGISIFDHSFSVSDSFNLTHLGASLTATAPQIGDISASTIHTQPGLVGEFETYQIDGALRLSANSLYENIVPTTIGATGELSLLAGGANEFITPGLTNLGRINIAHGSTLEITDASGFGNLDASGLLSGGSFDIDGTFTYVGPSITTNSTTLSVHGSLQHSLVPGGSSSDALATLSANTAAGVLTLGHNLTTALPFANDDSLTLDNSTLTVASYQQGASGSLFLNSNARLVATQADGFLNVSPSGTLSGGNYVIAGQVQYHGPSITTNDATLVLSGNRPSSSPHFTNGNHGGVPVDALASLALNTRDLALVNGAALTLDQSFANQGSVFAASGTRLEVQGDVTNHAGADIEIDGGTLEILGTHHTYLFGEIIHTEYTPFDFHNQGALTVSGGGQVNVSGTLGNFSDIAHSGDTAIFTGGTWHINGQLSYGNINNLPSHGGMTDLPNIREIGAGTVVNWSGGSGLHNASTSSNALSALSVNHGTLLLSGVTLDSQHPLANTGTLVVQNPGGHFSFHGALSNSGDIIVGAGATLSAQGAYDTHSQGVTWTNVGHDGSLSGVGRLFVAGTVEYRSSGGTLITRLASDTDLTLAGSGKFALVQSGGSLPVGFPLQTIDGALRLSDGAVFHATDGRHLTVNSGGTLQTGANAYAVFTGVDLTVQGGATLDNAGILFFDAAGHASRFGVSSGTLTLSGGGGVHFSDDAGNRLADFGGTLVNQDNVIGGSGTIAANLVNRGTIQSAGAVGLVVAPASGTLVNSGLIVAGGGVAYTDPEDVTTGSFVPSVLTLRDVAVTNHEGATQGRIVSGSELRIESSSVTGGQVATHANGTVVLDAATLDIDTLENATHGQITVAAGSTSSLRAAHATAYFGSHVVLEAGSGLELAGATVLQNAGTVILRENSTLSGTGQLDNYGTLHVLGAGVATFSAGFVNHNVALADIDQGATLLWHAPTLSNAGRIRLGPSGQNGVLRIQSSTTLGGGGRIELGGIVSTGDGPEDRAWAESGIIQAAAPGLLLTNTNHTISGVGRIGDDQLAFINSATGVVRADKRQGTLVIDPANGFTNGGSLVVENGARLELPETHGPFTHLGSLTIGGFGSTAGGTLVLAGLHGSLGSATVHLADSSARVELGSPGVALDTTFAGSLSGSGTFAKLGSGVTTLADVSAFTGHLDLQAGTLALSAAPAAATFTLGDATLRFTTTTAAPTSGSGVTVAGDAVIDIPSASGHVTLAHHSSLGGSGTLVKTGSGTLSIGGVNNFEGLLDIRAGTLGNDPLFSGWTIARSKALVAEGATLDLRGQPITLKQLDGAGTVTNSWTTGTSTLSIHGIDGDEVSEFDGSITDGGPGLGVTRLALVNAHAVHLSGVNTFTGGVSLANSALFLSGGAALHDHAAVELSANFDNTTLTVSDAETIGSLSGNGRVNLNAPLTLGANNLSTTASAYLTGAHGLTKTGDGTLSLLKYTFHNPNDYTGGTVLQSGAIAFDHNQAFGTGPLALDGGALQPVGARTLANALVLGGDVTLGSADALALTGAATLTGDRTLSIASGGVTLSGAIGQSGGHFGFTKTGSGAFTLAGTSANTFTGSTTVNSGSLVLAKTANVPALSGPVTVNSGGTLVYSGFNSLNAPAAVVTLAGGTFDIRGSGFHGFAGGLDYRAGSILTPDASVATPVQINLSANSPDAFTLRGGLSTPASLRLAFTGASATSGVTYDATGDTGLSTIHGTLELAGAGTFTIADSSAPVDLHVSGAIIEDYAPRTLVKTGPGTLQLSGANTYSGGTTLAAGTLSVSADSNLGHASGQITFSGGSLATTGSFSSSRPVTLSAAGSFRTDADSTLAWSGVLSGTGSLTKAGPGTLTLSGANTFSGPVSISSGTLRLSGGSAIPNTSAVSLANVSGAALDLAGSSETIGSLSGGGALGGSVSLGSGSLTTGADNTSTTFAGMISGTGSLTKTGAGALTLAGAAANTFAGPTTVSSGSLVLAKTANVPALSGPVTVNSGGTLVYSGLNSLNAPAAVVTLAGGAFDIRGSGFRGFAGGLDYRAGSILTPEASAAAPVQINLSADTPGAFTLRGGLSTPASLRLAFTGASPSSGVTYDATGDAGLSTIHGPLLLAGAGTFTIADSSALVDLHVEGAISEAYSSHTFAKTGPGTLRLSGHNTFTGATTISAGTLRVDGSIATSSHTTVLSGATLSGTGTVGPATIRSGGTLAPGASPGLLTFEGGLTLDAGSITVFEIAGLARGATLDGYDAINISGALQAGGTLTVSFSGGYTPSGPATFDFFNFTSFGGSFAQVHLPTVAGHTWNTSQLSFDGTISLVASAIPEPASFAVLAAALACGVSVFRRRRRA